MSTIELMNFDSSTTTKGFTGHEMLDEVGLIHMNGRIYDPRLGRFMQADPFIQASGNTQSYNRYSYIFNNPLAGTDPSGYFGFLAIFKFVLSQVITHVVHKTILSKIPGLSMISGIFACASGGIGACTQFAAHSAYAQTGSLKQAIKAGALAFASASAFSHIGNKFSAAKGFFKEGGLGHILSHGATGGVISVLQGGKFGHGFASAGLTKALSPAIGKVTGLNIGGKSVAQAAVAATVGGTISKATGGKFSNGAVTAAFGNLFNQQGVRESEDEQQSVYDEDTDRTYFAESASEKSLLKTNRQAFIEQARVKQAGAGYGTRLGSNSIKAHNEVYRNDLATDLDAVRSIGNAATSTGRFLIRPSVGSATNAIRDVGSGIENALTVPGSPSSSSRSAVDDLLGPNDGLKMESQ